MSYLRGKYYAYCCGSEEEEYMSLHGERSDCCGPEEDHHAILVPMAVFDQIVVMRFAELLKGDKWKDAVTRTAGKGHWNFGALDLANLIGYDPRDTWMTEWETSHEEHLAECDAKGCDKPGIHRFRHHHKVVTK